MEPQRISHRLFLESTHLGTIFPQSSVFERHVPPAFHRGLQSRLMATQLPATQPQPADRRLDPVCCLRRRRKGRSFHVGSANRGKRKEGRWRMPSTFSRKSGSLISFKAPASILLAPFNEACELILVQLIKK